jgi:hypothetical protein
MCVFGGGGCVEKSSLYAIGNLSKLVKAKKASETQKKCKEMPLDWETSKRVFTLYSI